MEEASTFHAASIFNKTAPSRELFLCLEEVVYPTVGEAFHIGIGILLKGEY